MSPRSGDIVAELFAGLLPEGVFAADDYSGVAIAGAAGPAVDLVRLFQLQLEHYEKIEGETLSLEGKANQLSQLQAGLFAAVNVARKLDIDPELELRRASERFRARVEVAERLARENGEDWSALPLERQDHYFDLAKELQ